MSTPVGLERRNKEKADSKGSPWIDLFGFLDSWGIKKVKTMPEEPQSQLISFVSPLTSSQTC